jgi:Carboxypeptidase regulatory-like domain
MKMPRPNALRVVLAVSVLVLTPNGAAAQSVLVRVLDGGSSQPIFGALAYLEDGAGATLRNALTDERGRALFVGLQPAAYRVRVEMIGMGTATTDVFEVPADATVSKDIRMESSAIVLEGIEVEAEGGRCSVRPEEGLLVAEVWDEARKALEAAAFTDDEALYRYRTVRYLREEDRDSRAIRSEERSQSSGYLRTPFESRPAEDLLENGFVQTDSEGDVYYAPDATVLLSDPFLDSHCFQLKTGKSEAAGLVGLAFKPIGRRKRVPDIAGTLWLDPNTVELKWLEFSYQNLNADLTSPDVGGRVDFQRMPNGSWIVPEWWIRMPTIAYMRDARGRRQPYLASYRVTGGIVTQVQDPGGRTVVEAETGTIEGIVLDSLGVEPLKGVRVGVVGSNQQVFTNAEGRFNIPGLTEGVFQVRFADPRLEAIGYRPEPVTQEVHKGEVASLRFVMPSKADILFEACRDEPRPEGTAVLMGWVRDARTSRPLPGATVQVRWTRYKIAGQGTGAARLTAATVDGLQVTADQEGYYRFCGVPEDQLLTVIGISGDVETPGDTLRIPELAGAKVLMIDIARER